MKKKFLHSKEFRKILEKITEKEIRKELSGVNHKENLNELFLKNTAAKFFLNFRIECIQRKFKEGIKITFWDLVKAINNPVHLYIQSIIDFNQID